MAARESAFSRIDLIVVVILVVISGIWFGKAHSGTNARIARCARNLSALGNGMDRYANENGDVIPVAGIDFGKIQTSWAAELFPYTDGNSRCFLCPSDPAVHHGSPRSYAMGANDMLPEHWPPGADSPTGVGLLWNKATVLSLLGKEKPEVLPAVKLTDLPAPADTLLLTEFIDPNNLMGGLSCARILEVSKQRQFFADGGASFHHGKFNYLLVDGHVELLSPLQTGSFDGSSGIWSIKMGD